MENPARLYHCHRCRRQVIVCSHCDRGQIYCAHHCAQLARRQSLHAAAQRYRQTLRGKLQQALRQRRYRQRQRLRQPEKVTHHRSLPEQPCDLLPPAVKKTRRPVSVAQDRETSCHFCGHFGWIFLRRGFLRHYSRLNDKDPPGRYSS